MAGDRTAKLLSRMNTRFLDRIQQPEILILDGAMGTELTRRGIELKLPLWSASAVRSYPETVRQIHLDYLTCGAEIITTTTFRTESYTFTKAGLNELAAKEACYQAVALAHDAIQIYHPSKPKYIAGSIAPLEDCYHPELAPDEKTIWRYQEQRTQWLSASGVDLLLLETLNNFPEIKITTQLALMTKLPVIVSCLIRNSDQLFDGTPIDEVLSFLHNSGVTAIGINCVHHSLITAFLEKYKGKIATPLIAYPNADYYSAGQWITDSNFTPSSFADIACKWPSAGVKIIGGCCGTNPTHIAELSRRLSHQTGLD